MGATTEATPGGEPSRSLEVELKFDVDESTPLPDWSALPGVASVAEPELRELDARYLDTATLDLARAKYALRRRTGGPDAGWHIKGPRVGDGRVELGWPLGPDGEGVPPAVRAAVLTVTDAALVPVARIRNTRTAHLLLDAAGAVVAEFVDDHVIATDERSGAERRWREWEFELGPAAPADPDERAQLFAAAGRAVDAAGGRAAASDSKLARALGA
ncbi:CYTH domain-containing protein [Planococcus sp. APC 4015]|nr:CYTH domain-containing protein [Planococcus sp. APC 4015]